MLDLSYLPAGPAVSTSHTFAGVSPAILQATIERCVSQIRLLIDAQPVVLDTPSKETALSNLGIVSGALHALSEHETLRSSISARTGLRYLESRTELVIASLRAKPESMAALKELAVLLTRELRLREM